MPPAVGPRFVLEAGFLVLLAVVVGFAELSPALIVLVMALGWLLVSLIEYFAWRQAPAGPLAPFQGPPPSGLGGGGGGGSAPAPPPSGAPAPATGRGGRDRSRAARGRSTPRGRRAAARG